MTPTLPFLYLPDAITLILLLVSFDMLRRVAVTHMRQELLIIRKEMLLYWLNNGLNPNEGGYIALRDLIDSLIKLTPMLSPGRLVFVYRLQKQFPFPNPSREAALMIEETANVNGREKLKRLQMEVNLGLGAFFLFGSLSGFSLLIVILPRILKRVISHHSKNRTDFFFDMVERVLGSVGCRAQQIGYAVRRPSRSHDSSKGLASSQLANLSGDTEHTDWHG